MDADAGTATTRAGSSHMARSACRTSPENNGQAEELIAAKWGLSRAELDEFSAASHQHTAAADAAGMFASVVLAWQRETGADLDRVNVHGGAIALGHPLGASGARLMTTLVHAMHARGAHLALQTMCEAGGTANATILERL